MYACPTHGYLSARPGYCPKQVSGYFSKGEPVSEDKVQNVGGHLQTDEGEPVYFVQSPCGQELKSES